MSFNPSKYLKSKWLKGSDLQPGRPMTVTVSAAREHYFEQSGETKPILEFSDCDQSLVLNKTMLGTLISLFGEDPRLWVGQRLTLLPVPSNYQGKPTLSISIAAAAAMPTFAGQPARRAPASPVHLPDDDFPYTEEPSY